MHVDLDEARARFSELVERAERGEEVVISRRGLPVARLVAYTDEERPTRRPGGWRGRVWIADDFDETDEELVRLFEGDEDEWSRP